MNIELSEPKYCQLQIKYETDAEEISKKKEEVVSKFKSRKVPGFRPNRATNAAIKNHFRKEIDQDLTTTLVQEAYSNVIAEKNIKPFGQPQFTAINLSDDKFTCEFSLFKQPDFELSEYKDFEIPNPAVGVNVDELSQKMLQDLRTKNGHTTAYDENDFVQMGDSIIIDYKTSMDNIPIEKLTATGDILNVGRINIPGFSENLLGMIIGETRQFHLQMPETYKEEYANKILTFEVSITSGSKIQPAALDDNLAKTVGIETFDKLEEAVKSTATNRVVELEKNAKLDQIIKRILSAHDFKVPEWMSSTEAKINAKNAGLNWESISDEDKLQHIENAENSIKLSLVLEKVRGNEPDAQLTDEEAFATAKQNIAKFSNEPEKVITEIFKNGHWNVLMNKVRDEAALDFIEKTCKFIE